MMIQKARLIKLTPQPPQKLLQFPLKGLKLKPPSSSNIL